MAVTALFDVTHGADCALASAWQLATAVDRCPADDPSDAVKPPGLGATQACRPLIRRFMSAWALLGHGSAAAADPAAPRTRIAKPTRINGLRLTEQARTRSDNSDQCRALRVEADSVGQQLCSNPTRLS